MSKKRQVIAELFEICESRNDYLFDNELVKTIAQKYDFKNPFDATKLDSVRMLPKGVIEKDFAVIHLGSGRHQFIKGVNNVYHNFEPIQTTNEWLYKKSLLNEFNDSESNILSVANNQRILHHFVFGQDNEFDDVDISQRPKTYFPHRTKTDLQYNFGKSISVELNKIQIEIDLTIEYKGVIGIFEAKNRKSPNFSIYQLYHPFLYYENARGRIGSGIDVKEIICTYVVRSRVKKTTVLSLWAYTFPDPTDIMSIKLLKSAAYYLVTQ